jgi:hypothetical protein
MATHSDGLTAIGCLAAIVANHFIHPPPSAVAEIWTRRRRHLLPTAIGCSMAGNTLPRFGEEPCPRTAVKSHCPELRRILLILTLGFLLFLSRRRNDGHLSPLITVIGKEKGGGWTFENFFIFILSRFCKNIWSVKNFAKNIHLPPRRQEHNVVAHDDRSCQEWALSSNATGHGVTSLMPWPAVLGA